MCYSIAFFKFFSIFKISIRTFSEVHYHSYNFYVLHFFFNFRPQLFTSIGVIFIFHIYKFILNSHILASVFFLLDLRLISFSPILFIFYVLFICLPLIKNSFIMIIFYILKDFPLAEIDFCQLVVFF